MVFRTRNKSAWDWTMMIAQPEWITPELVDEALAAARKKQLPALSLVRFERYAEGRSAQILHVGETEDYEKRNGRHSSSETSAL